MHIWCWIHTCRGPPHVYYGWLFEQMRRGISHSFMSVALLDKPTTKIVGDVISICNLWVVHLVVLSRFICLHSDWLFVLSAVVNMGEVSASPPTTVPFFHLDDCHARRVIQALHCILATEVAEQSFSMLIDGRLTMKALRACRRIRLGEDYDEIAKYTGPSQDTISMFRSLREQFDLSHVLIKASVCYVFP